MVTRCFVVEAIFGAFVVVEVTTEVRRGLVVVATSFCVVSLTLTVVFGTSLVLGASVVVVVVDVVRNRVVVVDDDELGC